MKITICPDSMKEGLSAAEMSDAIAEGMLRVEPKLRIEKVPLADGGEGTVDALVAARNGNKIQVPASDPLGRTINAEIGLFNGNKSAVIEMVAASGLALLKPEERNPLHANTAGTGDLIKAALDAGVEEIIIGIGGSATVDCGIGMADTLGIRFFDESGSKIEKPSGKDLQRIDKIDASGLDPRLKNVAITVASDVTNVLLGQDGAARVYGPQKGASPEEVKQLETGLSHLASIIKRDLKKDITAVEGGGAAGGLGAGLAAFLDAEIKSGIDTIMEASRLAERMCGSRFAVTGEGRVDYQSAFGKVPAGVLKVAENAGIPVIIIAGSLGPGYEKLYRRGACGIFSICNKPMPLEEAFSHAGELLAGTSESILRLWKAAESS